MLGCLLGSSKLQKEQAKSQQLLEEKDSLASSLAALQKQHASLQNHLAQTQHQLQLQAKLNESLVEKAEMLQAELLRAGSMENGLKQQLMQVEHHSRDCEDQLKVMNHRLGASLKDRDKMQKKNAHLEQAIHLLQQVVQDFQHAEEAGAFTPSASMKSSLRQSTEALQAILKQSRQYELVQPLQQDNSAASRKDQKYPVPRAR